VRNVPHPLCKRGLEIKRYGVSLKKKNVYNEGKNQEQFLSDFLNDAYAQDVLTEEEELLDLEPLEGEETEPAATLQSEPDSSAGKPRSTFPGTVWSSTLQNMPTQSSRNRRLLPES